MRGVFLTRWSFVVTLGGFLMSQIAVSSQPETEQNPVKTEATHGSFLTSEDDFQELSPEESAQVLAGLENEFRHMTTFTGSFVQTVLFPDGQKVLYSGDIYWKQPQMVIDLPNFDQRIVVNRQWMSTLNLKKRKRSTHRLPGYLSQLFKGKLRIKEQFPEAKVYWDPRLKLAAVALQPKKSSYRFYLYCSRFEKNKNIKNIVGWFIVDNKGVKTLLLCLEGTIKKRINFDGNISKLFNENYFEFYQKDKFISPSKKVTRRQKKLKGKN